MFFTRSVPKRRYRDYTRYRDLLRQDFQYRCAYCLIHEFHNGGAANFAIDHHRPVRGSYARPDLAGEYANLYWCCSECNQNKADCWPAPQQEAQGFRWIDPCEPWGEHSLHWRIAPDGNIQWLTPAGEYTIRMLMLHRREDLKAHWQRLRRLTALRDRLTEALAYETVSASLAGDIHQQIAEINEYLEPPVFSRPRRER